MSTTVEKRVLDMQLKTSEFEKNAAKTISTLSQLKSSLNFTGVGKGFDDITKSANNVKFDQLLNSVDEINSKFSVLNTAVRNVFSDMVSKAVSTGTQILNAFAFEPITSGFSEYESKIGSIQTILANTASRQKEVSQDVIQSINEEATAAVAKQKEVNEEAISNLQESQAAQDRALQRQFESQSKAFEKQASAQTKAFEKQASAKLEAFDKETKKETDALEKSYDARYKALEKEQEQEVKLQEQAYEEKYKALEKAQKEELKVLEKAYKEQTKAYEKEVENQNKVLEDKFDAETEALEESINEQIELIEEQQETELKALEKSQQEELEAVEAKYESEIEAAEKAADQELDILEDKYNEQLDLLKETTDAQMDALEDYYDDAMEALEDSQDRESEILKKNHDARLDMYEEEYMAKLKVADEDRYNQIKAIDNEISSIKNLEKAEKAEREEAENRRKLQELEADVSNAKTVTERTRAEQKLAEFRDKLSQEAVSKERDRRIAELEAQKDGINEAYEMQKQNLQEEYNTKKANEDELYSTQKKNMDDLHKDQKEALQEQEEQEKKALQKEIEDKKAVLKEQYDYEKEILEEQKKAQLDAIKEQQKAEKEALKEQQDAAKDALKKKQKQEKEALKKQTDEQKKALKEQQALEKEALKEQQDAIKESYAELYSIQKENLTERHNLQKEALQNENEQEKQALEESFDARKERLDQQKEAEMTALEERRETEKKNLEEQIDAEREALKDRIDSERTALKNSQSEQKAALDSRQKAELKAMKARHKQELANIETEKQARIAALNNSAGMTEASSLEEVNAALDELNKYADDTIYNFADMTRNIGTFTAAGVELDDSVLAIKGIANLAALSGSNAQQASTAMYQLSQAISAGSVKLQDWNSVVNAGMGGAQFREALKETARAHGIEVDKMIAKEGSFRDSLKHGWITSEVLLETLSKFTGDLTDEQLKSMGYTDEQIEHIQMVAQNAVDAATKVRTWSQLIDTTKEALGSGWSETFELIFGNFDEATALWSEVSKVVNNVIDQQAEARNQLLTGWKDSGGRQDLIDAVKNVFNGVQEILKPVQEAFANVFPPVTVKTLTDFTAKLKELTSKFKLSKETSDKLRTAFEGLFSGVKMIGQAFGAFFKALSPVWGLLGKVVSKVLDFASDLGGLITKVSQAADEMGIFNKAADGIKSVLEFLFGSIGSLVGPVLTKIDDFRSAIVNAFGDAILKSAELEGPFGKVIEVIGSVKDKAAEFFNAIKDWVTTRFGTIDTSFLTSFAGSWTDIYEKIKTEHGGFIEIFKTLAEGVTANGSKIVDLIKLIGEKFSEFAKDPVNAVKTAASELIKWFGSLPEMFSNIKDGIGGAIQSLVDLAKEKFKAPDLSSIFSAFDILTGQKIDTSKVAEAANSAAETITKSFDNGKISALKQAVTKFAGFIKSAIDFINKNMNFDEVLFTLGRVSTILAGFGIDSILFSFSKLEKGIAKVVKGFKNIGKSVTKVVDNFSETVKSFTGLIDGLKENFKDITKSVSTTIESFKSIPESISGTFDQLKESIGKIGQTRKIDKIKEIAGLILVLAASVRILAGAIKMVSDIDGESLAISIGGITSLIIALGGTALALSKYGGEAKVNSIGILSLAIAVNIVAKAVQKIGEMGTEEAIQGGIGALSALGGLAGASYWIGNSNFDASAGLGLIEMAGALLIIQKAMEKFAELKTEEFIQGGSLVAGALTAISLAANKIGQSNFSASQGVGIVGMAAALVIMSKALEEFGKLHILTEIVPGLIGMGGALFELTFALNKMQGTTGGAVALGILAVAMIPMAKAFTMMSEISFGQIVTGLLGFGGALAAILVASALITPFSGGLIALAAALAAFGLVVIGIGAGLSALTLAISTLATVSTGGLAAVIGAFGVLAEGILDTLIKLTPKVTQFIAGLIEQMCEIMLAKKQFMFETGFTLLLTILDMLAERGPELIDKLAQVIIMILDGLKLYGPEIVEKAVELAVSLFATIIDTLNKQDPDTLIHAVEAFAGISALMLVCAGLSKIAVPAMKGLGELGVFVVELIAIISLIGGLGQMPGFTWLINEGGKVLEAVGLAIGGFFGGIVGGVVKGATSVLPQVGTQISQFMENADYFLKHVSEVGDDQKKGAKNLASIIASLTGASLLDSIANIVSDGGQRYSRLGTELSQFAETAQPFFDAMKDLGVSGGVAMVGVNAIAEAVMTLTKQKILDGITAFITGGSSLKSFGEELKAFGPSVKSYAKSTNGIDGKAVEGSANAIKILAKAAKALPNDGGVVAYWTGDNSLQKFGEELKAFGPNLKAYADEVKDISSESVEGSANAIKVLSRAAKVIPNSGGKIAAWLGDNKLDDFGAQLVSFGPDLASYAESVKDISEKKVKASARAAEALAGLANNLPETGGFLQAFLGEQSLEDFGDDLESFGTSLATYSDTIKNIGEGAIASSAAAAATLVALANDLPEEKGLFGKLFGGEQSLETFGKNLKTFGAYMVEYYNNVKEIPTTNNLYGIGLIASKMIDIALDIQNIDVKDLKSLGENMEKLGEGENDYYDEVSDIDFDKVSKSITQINRLVALADVLKDFDSDLFKTFGSAMKSLADAGVSDFADAFDEAYDDCVEAINKFVAAISKGILGKKEDMADAGEKLGAEVPSGLVTGMNSKGREINDAILLITGAIVTAFSTNLPADTFKGIGSGATNAIKDGFSAPGRDILSTITTLTGGLVKQFQSGLSSDTFKGIGKACNTSLADGFKDTITRYNVTTAAANVCTGIKKAFSDNLTYDQMKAIGVNATNGLIYGFIGGTDPLSRTVYNVATAAKNTLSSNLTYESAKNSAVNFINGMIEGIGNGSFYVNQAVKTVAQNAVNTLNNVWEIHSPSRITYEAGSFYDEGAAKGITDNAYVITDAIEDVGYTAQSAWSDLDTNMSSTFSDGLDLSSTAMDSMSQDAEMLSDSYVDLDDTMTQTYTDGLDLSNSTTETIVDNTETVGQALLDNNESLNTNIETTNTFSGNLNNVTTLLKQYTEETNKCIEALKNQITHLEALASKLMNLISKTEQASVKLENFKKNIKAAKTSLGNLSKQIAKVIDGLGPLKNKIDKVADTFEDMAKSVAKAADALQEYDQKYASSMYAKMQDSESSSGGYTSTVPDSYYSKYTSDYSSDLEDLLGSSTSSDGYLSYGSGSSSFLPSGTDYNSYLDDIAGSVSDRITDEMREQDVDMVLDISDQLDSSVQKAVKNNTKKNKNKKENNASRIGSTSALKAAAAQMTFDQSNILADNTSAELEQTKKAKTDAEEYNKQLQAQLDKAIQDATNNSTTNVDYNNIFNIQSSDPQQSANEIGRILQQQVERTKAVWGS